MLKKLIEKLIGAQIFLEWAGGGKEASGTLRMGLVL